MVNQRWGFSVVVAAVVGIGIGVLIAVLTAPGSEPRLVIGVGIGLIMAGGLLAIFERLVVRRLLAPSRAFVYEESSEPIDENGMPITRRAVPAFDSETGEPLVRSVSSSFFGLTLEVWTLFLVGFGILGVGIGVVMYLAS